MGHQRICCAQGECLMNLPTMACPSKAVILDVLMTDEDWVKIDGCLRTRDQPRTKLRHHPGQKMLQLRTVWCYVAFSKSQIRGRLWKEHGFSSFSKSCDLVTYDSFQ